MWLSDGWRERFGLPYGPEDLGYGQSSEQVSDFTLADPALLVDYHAAVHELALRVVDGLDDAGFSRVLDRSLGPARHRGRQAGVRAQRHRSAHRPGGVREGTGGAPPRLSRVRSGPDRRLLVRHQPPAPVLVDVGAGHVGDVRHLPAPPLEPVDAPPLRATRGGGPRRRTASSSSHGPACSRPATACSRSATMPGIRKTASSRHTSRYAADVACGEATFDVDDLLEKAPSPQARRTAAAQSAPLTTQELAEVRHGEGDLAALGGEDQALS